MAQIYAALIALKLGDSRSSAEHAERATELTRAHSSLVPMAKAALARALLARGQIDRALEEATESVALANSSDAVVEGAEWTSLALAEAQVATGQSDLAKETIRRARDAILAHSAARADTKAASLKLPIIAETLELAAQILSD